MILHKPIWSFIRLFAVCAILCIGTACSQQIQTVQPSFIAVDAKKYKTNEEMLAAMSKARNECSAPRQATDYQTGRNAVSAIRAQNDEANQAVFEGCMAQKGFLRQN